MWSIKFCHFIFSTITVAFLVDFRIFLYSATYDNHMYKCHDKMHFSCCLSTKGSHTCPIWEDFLKKYWMDFLAGMLILGLGLGLKDKFIGLGFGTVRPWPWPWACGLGLDLGLECSGLGIKYKAIHYCLKCGIYFML